VYRPSARPRAAPSKLSWIPVSTWEIMSAAPTPWMIRATTRMSAFGASPQAREVGVNRPSPRRNTRRYPRMSPSRALVIISIAYARV